MKKTFFALCFLLASYISLAQNQGNYIVIINNDSIRIDLDKSFLYEPSKGKPLQITITQPNTLTYSDDIISFEYDKSLSVSNTQIEQGIEQCAILKATGNGFMVQKYKAFNPSGLTRLMLNEITKESISYGYTKTEKPFVRELRSGHTIEGIHATLTYKGEEEDYIVATYGGKDEGILILTMLMTQEFPDDKKLIDLFLETLEIK